MTPLLTVPGDRLTDGCGRIFARRFRSPAEIRASRIAEVFAAGFHAVRRFILRVTITRTVRCVAFQVITSLVSEL
jgi:hypothetical protein